MGDSILVTNFAYGTGPYLRTTELALAVNRELEKRGKHRMRILVPWVYGERQKQVMLEEFGAHDAVYPGEILLDPKLGAILKSVFYSGRQQYEETLKRWVNIESASSRDAHEYLRGNIDAETLDGKQVSLHGKDIALEVNRSPRIRYDIAPSYSTTFGYVADILEKAAGLPEGHVALSRELLQEGVRLADRVEGNQTMHCVGYPATFSFDSSYTDRYGGTLVPPVTDLPKDPQQSLSKEGIFVTITGIEGLERLYQEARDLGLALYSNDPHAVPGSTHALPSVIKDPNIKLQFARAGWGSLWLSMFLKVPVLVPRYDPTDDPEIYFNNIALENLGFGIVYRGQPLKEILAQGDTCRGQAQKYTDEIIARWGTLNGNDVCAKMFVDHFLSV